MAGVGAAAAGGTVGALALANQGRRIEAVHSGHPDVEQDEGEVRFQDLAKSVPSGGDGHDMAVLAAQQLLPKKAAPKAAPK